MDVIRLLCKSSLVLRVAKFYEKCYCIDLSIYKGYNSIYHDNLEIYHHLTGSYVSCDYKCANSVSMEHSYFQ